MAAADVRVGVVMGAGGVAGVAWHAGTLAALQEATGFDARDADLVVGTSAGSIAGIGLRSGLSPADQYATAVDEPPSPEGAALLARVVTSEGRFGGRRSGRTPFRPSNPALVRALAPWDRRGPVVALAGLMPEGRIDPAAIGIRVEELAGGSAWPDRPYWAVAVRLRDGRRVVFGRDLIAPLGAAVTASCAVPALFAPITIGEDRYIDGGVHSTTNVALVAGEGLDVVVVSAPMAGAWRSLRPNPIALSRASARARLDREVAAVKAGGAAVLVLQPAPGDTALMDGRAMDERARVPIARRARESVLRQLDERSSAGAVEALRSA
jgi:NTE family protein